MNTCYNQTLLTVSRVDFEKLPTAGVCLRTDGPRHKLSSKGSSTFQTDQHSSRWRLLSVSISPLTVCFEQRLGNTHTHTEVPCFSHDLSGRYRSRRRKQLKKLPTSISKLFKKKICNLQTELGRMWLIFWPLLSFHLLRENTFWPLRLCSHVLSLHGWRGAVDSLVHKLFSVTVKSNKKKKGDHCWRFYPRNGACLVGWAAPWGRGWCTPIWLNSTFQLIFTGFIYKQSFSMQSQ